MNTKNINIFCMNCGRRLTADAQFCPSCGAEVVRSEQPKQQEQPEQIDRCATQYAEDPVPYEQFEPYDTPRYAPPPSEPAARGQEVPKSLYAIVLSLTLAGMIVVGVIGGMIIHFTRSGGEKVHTAQTTTAAPQPIGRRGVLSIYPARPLFLYGQQRQYAQRAVAEKLPRNENSRELYYAVMFTRSKHQLRKLSP